ncbi:hypothetical protein BN7_2389 [Wickerhamomyces ciferrii]|uniref:Altered inheritance of mitochondria protein 6 n=1 Tax=Wickerhamomyces ciferrii (strain ATCC 14091 / BCRC 22168 / CBS 111 / JCM 3599 / NBRC 0793 / NRRL Y-1031 F-60-10) TaxID=1206466 RepID=K0KNA3_WICCF|nr:uncharacterized protein BN7_2389 [Wickerhamomyces ciferrii]CCH42844.1 hypothetical protein BN7_2389 [Wickerhamomyces ciferrii]
MTSSSTWNPFKKSILFHNNSDNSLTEDNDTSKNIRLSQFNINSDEESQTQLEGFQNHVSQQQSQKWTQNVLNPFRRNKSRVMGLIVSILLLVNVSLCIVLVVFIKSNEVPTFFGDYLTSHNNLNPQSASILRYKTAITSENKIELMNKDQNVLPVHSHNDYWRKTPLFEALRLGISSVEADVWGFPNDHDSYQELYVGHKKLSLSKYKTLNSLYLSNIEALLDDVNSKVSVDQQQGTDATNDTLANGLQGVFYNDPSKSLDLIIDIKTNGNDTLPLILKNLKPLISKNYLSYYNTTSEKFNKGPLTITISGNIPFEKIQEQNIRYTFIDAPLNDPDFSEKFNSTNSIYGSSSLEKITGSKSALGFNGLDDDQKTKIKEVIDIAHAQNIKTRIWDTPNWPVSVRNSVWKDLLELGVDLLNADDLKGAVMF